jgi:adenosylhomocysteinase
LSVCHIARSAGKLQNRVYAVPQEIDSRIALLKLETLGVCIDRLNDSQKAYLGE